METTSLTLALKTDTSDNPKEQWVHLVPSGQFAARDGRGTWRLTNPDQVIEKTKQYAGKNLLPIDYEHQIDLSEKNGHPAPAAGWIQGLQNRDDGIWGLVEWTDKAVTYLANKEYKYLSPVIHFNKKGEIIRLLRAGLTNNPALDMTALAKADNSLLDDETHSTDQANSNDLSEIAHLLGLDDNANLNDVKFATKSLLSAKNTASPDLKEFVPLGEFERVVLELKEIEEGKFLAKVNDAIDNGLIPIAFKEWGVSIV